MFRSKAAQSPHYRADIDGLRAVAIVAVFFYHAGLPSFAGGFVGVDIFFVISGYLISSLLIRDIAAGQFSFTRFYAHRIRRIFPAYFAIMAVTTFVASFVFAPSALKEYAKGLLAATTFSSNIYFFNRPFQTYFQQVYSSEALLHTWSLSVEEQFYLLFPAALFLCFTYVKSRRQAAVGIAFFLSFALSIWGTGHAPSATFYLLPSRMWEFLAGTLVCMVTLTSLRHRALREAAGFAGLAMIAYSIARYDSSTLFPGWHALLPCAGAALILYAGSYGGSTATSLLKFPPLVMIGVISYSLYLIHWPVIVLQRYCLGSSILLPGTLLYTLLGCLALSCLSFLLVESPFRKSSPSFSNKRVIAWGLVAAGALASLCLFLIGLKGLPQRYDAPTRELLAINSDRKTDNTSETCDNWGRQIRTYADVNFCQTGHESRNILFVGDSHIHQLMPLIRQLAREQSLDGHGAIYSAYGGCPFAQRVSPVSRDQSCDAFTRFTLVRALNPDVDTVFIQFSPWWIQDGALCVWVEGRCAEKLSGEEGARRVLEELSESVRLLRSNGKRVILGLPFPVYDQSIPDFEIRRLILKRLTAVRVPVEQSPQTIRRQIREIAKSTGSSVYDPRQSLCSGSACIYEIEGKSLYFDSGHLASSQLSILKPELVKTLQASR